MSELPELLDYFFLFWRLVLSSDFRKRYFSNFVKKSWFGRIIEVIAILISAAVGVGGVGIVIWFVLFKN
jgi:hypothetical protein